MGNQTRKATDYSAVVPQRVPWLLAIVGCEDGGVVADKIERVNRWRGLGRGLLGGGVVMFGKKVGLPESRPMTYTVQFEETLRLSKSRAQQRQSTSPDLYS